MGGVWIPLTPSAYATAWATRCALPSISTYIILQWYSNAIIDRKVISDHMHHGRANERTAAIGRVTDVVQHHWYVQWVSLVRSLASATRQSRTAAIIVRRRSGGQPAAAWHVARGMMYRRVCRLGVENDRGRRRGDAKKWKNSASLPGPATADYRWQMELVRSSRSWCDRDIGPYNTDSPTRTSSCSPIAIMYQYFLRKGCIRVPPDGALCKMSSNCQHNVL